MTNTRCSLDILRDCIPIFEVLKDEQRQDILMNLFKHRELCVNDIVEMSRLSKPAISHHLKLLHQSGLVSYRKEGTKKLFKPELDSGLTLLKDLLVSLEKEKQGLEENKNVTG